MIRYQSNDDYCSVDDIGAVYIFISIKVIKVTPCMSNGMDSSDEHTYGSIYIATLGMVMATTVIMEIIKTSVYKHLIQLVHVYDEKWEATLVRNSAHSLLHGVSDDASEPDARLTIFEIIVRQLITYYLGN